jgi:hypothetical protein
MGAMDALVGKAKDQLAIEGKDDQLANLRLQIERNVAALAAESDARLAAEMELIGAVTARNNSPLRSRICAHRSTPPMPSATPCGPDLLRTSPVPPACNAVRECR